MFEGVGFDVGDAEYVGSLEIALLDPVSLLPTAITLDPYFSLILVFPYRES